VTGVMTATRPANRRHAQVMGTVASFHVHGAVEPQRADLAIDAALAELERLEQMFSTFRPTSQISRVNAGQLDLLDCSPEVIDVLDACAWLAHASDDAFTIHRNGRLDPAGFVKGWAAERAGDVLTAHGIENFYLSVGGDLMMRGTPDGCTAADGWAIAIVDPTGRGATCTDAAGDHAVVASITVHGGAVATSGTAERGDHLWAGDGSPAVQWASVTVLGPSLTWADAFATTACAIGEHGLDWVLQFDGYRAFGVRPDGTLVNTELVSTPIGEHRVG
jgi:FAD:protein FMN transferase